MTYPSEEMIMNQFEIHADDYALSSHTSEDLLACLRLGGLDSLSVLTNMSCYEEYAQKYQEEFESWPKKPDLSVHLNFMEGHCVAAVEKVQHLVNQDGYFNISWKTLLFWSYSPKKYYVIKKELKEEIKAQTERFLDFFGNKQKFRFDGHQHTQMIPLVYWALLEVIVEQRYPTEYIRVTKEPILPYIKLPLLWRTYRPVNLVKNLLLNFLSFGMEHTINRNRPLWQQENMPMLLWGVLMSGKMDKERVERLFPIMVSYAKKKKRHLEILFHPGTALPQELLKEFRDQESVMFYISKDRSLEYETVISFLESNMGKENFGEEHA